MTFYATAVKVTKDGEKQILIDNLPSSRVLAVKEAMRIAKRDKLINLDIRIASNTKRGGSILTKNAEKRKKQRGK